MPWRNHSIRGGEEPCSMSREIMRDKEEIKSVYEIHKSKGQMDVRSSLELKVSQKLMAKEEAERGQKNCKGNKSQKIYLVLNSS